jgi:hypothetical protein
MNQLYTFSTPNYSQVSYEQGLQILMDSPWHTPRDKRSIRRMVIKDIKAKMIQICDAWNNHHGQRSTSFEVQAEYDYLALLTWLHKFHKASCA